MPGLTISVFGYEIYFSVIQKEKERERENIIMPWCPVCKNEYREGYTHCRDCDVDLVESLEVAPKAIVFGEQPAMEGMLEYLEDHHFEGAFIRFDEKEKQYELYVPYDKQDDAKNILQGYVHEIMEMQQMAQREVMMMDEDEEGINRKRSQGGAYEDKHAKAEDYKSSAVSLILVGGLGILFEILFLMDIFPFRAYGMSKYLIGGVMGVMFVGFIIMGIVSARSYKEGLHIASKEDELIDKIRTYALENLTRETIDQMAHISVSEEEDEMQYYYQRAAIIKAKINEQFHPNIALLDSITDDLYTEIFEG